MPVAEAFDFHQDLRKLTHGQVRLFFLRKKGAAFFLRKKKRKKGAAFFCEKKPQMRFHLTLTLHLLDTYFDQRAVSVRARPNNKPKL